MAIIPAGSLALSQFGTGLIQFLSSIDGSVIQTSNLVGVNAGGAVESLADGRYWVEKSNLDGKAGGIYRLIVKNEENGILSLADSTYNPDIYFRSNLVDRWYVAAPVRVIGSPTHYTSHIYGYDGNGGVVYGPVTLPDPGGFAGGIELKAFCISPDLTKFYMCGNVSATVADVARILRFDSTTHLYLSDLATIGPGPSPGDNFGYQNLDMCVLTNGNILIASQWQGVNDPQQVAGIISLYQPDGTLLNTFNVVNSLAHIRPRILLATDPDGVTFWCTFTPDATNDNTINTIQHWDTNGTILSSFVLARSVVPFAPFFITRKDSPENCAILTSDLDQIESSDSDIILSKCGGGVFQLDSTKTNDLDKAIPNPYIVTALIGDE